MRVEPKFGYKHNNKIEMALRDNAVYMPQGEFLHFRGLTFRNQGQKHAALLDKITN
jgi:hypothetical protein